MKKDKFITVMAILDDTAQAALNSIRCELEAQYGPDRKSGDIPFHISLGSYAVEDTAAVTEKVLSVAGVTRCFEIGLRGLKQFGQRVRYMEPELCDSLLRLHAQFDSDFANGFDHWLPHITVYRHSEPREIELSPHSMSVLEQLTGATVVGLELGEFFPPDTLLRVPLLCDPSG